MGQTDSLNISWDPNSEPDILRYKLQRSVNSTGNFEDFQITNHPLTHVADQSVEAGKLYAYRAAAIDSAGNMSLYTAPVSVGIPEIQWQLTTVTTGQNTTVPRSSFLSDPDNNVEDLQIQVSQENHVSITVQNANLILSPSPSNYTGPASFTLRAEDSDELYDLKAISFEFIEGSSIVFVVEIPDAAFDEDGDFKIKMDTTVTHSNYAANEISWNFMAGPDLQYDYDASKREITIQSKLPNWFGSDQIIAIATAPDQTTEVDTFAVEIFSVNDPPQASIQNLFISPQSNNLFDLKLYVVDVDHTPEELTWEFLGYNDFSIEWYDEAGKIIKITPGSNAASETGSFRVSDPENASDTKQVTLTYVENNTPPHLTFQNEISMAEDSVIFLNLVNFVTDSTNTISELTWQFDVGPNLQVQHNPANHTLTIQPGRDWFGQSSIDITVSDPFGLSDQQQVGIVVENRNDIQALSIRNKAGGEISVNIQMEIPSTIDFRYWYNLYQVITISMVNFQTQHSFNLYNIAPDTTYHFSLFIRDENGRSLSIDDSVFHTGASVSPLAKTELIVYPNPVKTAGGHNEMIFTNLPEETKTICLYSILGERVFEEALAQPEATEHRINIVNNTVDFPSGLYIYMLRDEKAKVLESGKIAVIR